MTKHLVFPAQFVPTTPLLVRHNLSEHPLLTLPAVTALAKRLPKKFVRYHSGKLSVKTRFDEATKANATGLTIEETMENIEQSGSFVSLQHIQTDAEYKGLVDEVLADIRDAVEPFEANVGKATGCIFVSSPNSVTPYHRDHEGNFLMQVRGTKLVRVWDPADPNTVNDREQEVFHAAWTLKETIYRDELEQSAYKMELHPGECAFMPFTAPHWVQNGPAVSVSIAVTFLTDRSYRETNVFRANYLLRKLGVKPARYKHGRFFGVRDALKDYGMRLYGIVRGRSAGYETY